MNDGVIDQSLRALDPMPHEVSADSLRARRALDAIVQDRPVRRSRSRIGTRLAMAGGVAAALALGAVVVPGMSGTPVAYADWTTTSTPLDEPGALAGMRVCFDDDMGVPSQAPTTVIGEQRGQWTFVAVSWSNGENGSCLFRTTPDSGEHTLGMGVFAGDPTTIGGRPFPVPAPDSIEASGLLNPEQSAGDVYQLTGVVGSEVERVVIHAGRLGDVEATVKDGRFAAWWPEARISPVLPFDPDVTLHLRDGRTVTQELSSFTHIQK